MEPSLNKEAKELIKEILKYLKIARSADHLTYHALVSSKRFEKVVLAPLEKLINWKEGDEKEVMLLGEKLAEETSGKTIQERTDKLHQILKIGGGIATGAGILTGLAYLLKKNHKNGE